MTTLYGIKNCDSIKRARRWLDKYQVEYRFHDFRVDGIETQAITNWIEQVEWQNLLNKRSTSWRNLNSTVQQGVNADTVISLLEENPTLIKRPVLDANGIITIGFNTDTYQRIFN